MLSRSVDEDALYQAYQSELAGERMARSMRTGIVVVASLDTLFILLDYFAYPDRFWLLAGVRMALNCAMGLLYWRAPYGNPLSLKRSQIIH